MRIIKPLRLGLLTRPYSMRGRLRLGVSVMTWATLAQAGELLPEAQMWEACQSRLDEDEAIDLGIPKPCGEFLVSGRAWSHDPGQPGACAVRARVGTLDKQLIVSGDRHWRSSGGTPVATAAMAVAGVPMDWRHTYGGPGVPENPMGRGEASDDRLPNVEGLHNRVTRPGQAALPVSFGPVSPVRPRRFARAGKYDENWLTQGFPGLPDTLDPHFFNAASPDQWWTTPAVADAVDYEIWNMHPTRAHIAGRLPHWRARCFVLRRDAGGATGLDSRVHALEEIASMALTTVWFFPDIERVMMIFQGACDVTQDDAADVELIMPALEWGDRAPRSIAHYRQTLARRLDPEHGGLYALRDSDLVPADVMREFAAYPPGTDALTRPQAVNQRQRGDTLRRDMLARAQAMGHDAADYPLEESVPTLTSMDDLPDYIRTMRRRTREAKVRMGRAQQAHQSRLAATFPARSQPALKALQAEVKSPPAGGPPSFGGQGGAAQLLDQARQAGARPGDPMSVDALQATIDQATRDLANLYRHAAHHQAPAALAPGGRSVRMRRRVQSLMQGSRDLSGLDLTGVDLSGLDLSGARARGVWMERADLSGTLLRQADLTDAVLTRAQLTGASLDEANLKGANLGHVQATSATFRGARFQETVLDGAELTGCDFTASDWQACVVADAQLTDVVCADVQWDNVVFWQDAAFERCRFEGAHLNRVVWLDAVLDGVSFSQATLVACAWVQVDCVTPMSFVHARLQTCCAVDTDMTAAQFTHAVLQTCNFRGLVMDQADFTNAALQSCDFSGASLRAAAFSRADARESLFMGCDLTGADFRQAELIDALMQKSDYRLTDLRGANLFRADISQSRLDDTTRTDGAYIRHVKTLPHGNPTAAPGSAGGRS